MQGIDSYSAYIWTTIGNALYIAVDFISQLILVSVLKHTILFQLIFFPKLYRCWILWRQPLVMVIPCILSLGYLGANLRKLTDFQTNFAS